MNSKLFYYRPDIDGMRAIAVAAVLLYHIFPSTLPGGFVGVDIFFVISGYLISSIIFNDLKRDKFKFHEFYVRRIKRIFPALLLMLLVVGIWGAMVLLPAEQLSLWLIVRKTTSFLTNIHLYKSTFDYFSTVSDNQKPLLHMWSLSVEEQFYIIYPILIWVIYKIKKELILPALLVSLLVSFSLSVAYISSKKEAVFYLLHFRAWELLIGSILAYFVIFSNRFLMFETSKLYLLCRSSYLIKNLVSFIAIFLIIYPCLALTGKDVYPGMLALYPTIGAALLIINKDSLINRYILSNKVFVYIGLISYPLYLWHWPIVSFANIANLQISALVGVGILVGSLIAAIITTFVIERPIRVHSSSKSISFLLVSAMAMFFVLSAACCRLYIKPAEFFLSPDVMKVASAINDWDYPSRNLTRDKTNPQFYSFGSGNKKVVFFGDSNVEQYWPRVEHLMLHNNMVSEKYNVLFATYGSTIPIPLGNSNTTKNTFVTNTLEYIVSQDFDTVVFGASWAGHFFTNKNNLEEMYNNFENMLVKLKEHGKKVFVILNIPNLEQQDPKKMLDCNRHFASVTTCKINAQKFAEITPWLSKYSSFMKRLKDTALNAGANVIDPIDTLCPHGNCFILDDDNRPVYKDSSHLTASYVRRYGAFIDEVFKN